MVIRPAPGSTGPGITVTRRDYLMETGRLLWPAPATVSIGAAASICAAGSADREEPDGSGKVTAREDETGARTVREFLLVPGASNPRLLLPARRRPASAAVLGFNKNRSRRARVATGVLRLALASGAAPWIFRDRLRVCAATPGGEAGREEEEATIEAHLSRVLDRDLVTSLHIGPARANRKPVLQLLSPAGDIIGFAKLGITPLTRDLVCAERDALAHLAGSALRTVTVPPVLHAGHWRGLEVLVLDALPTWRLQRQPTRERLVEAMREVGEVDGGHVAALASTTYWEHLETAVAEIGHHRAGQELRRGLDRIASAHGSRSVVMGAWHGDWTAWNMALVSNSLLLWDWERFTGGVPLGFDRLHYHLQDAIVAGRRKPADAARDTMREAPRLLAPFGMDAADSHVIGLLYLVELAARYLRDGQARAGAQLGRVEDWLLPEITRNAL